jgi:hypothetical protein
MKSPAAFLIFVALTGFDPAAAQADRLPDGEVTRFGGWAAWLTGPTTRFAHGASGDTIEASGFAVNHAGRTLTFELDENHVFEDRRVRLVELDGDPSPECVIIRASLTGGAAIAVYTSGLMGFPSRPKHPISESPTAG